MEDGTLRVGGRLTGREFNRLVIAAFRFLEDLSGPLCIVRRNLAIEPESDQLIACDALPLFNRFVEKDGSGARQEELTKHEPAIEIAGRRLNRRAILRLGQVVPALAPAPQGFRQFGM